MPSGVRTLHLRNRRHSGARRPVHEQHGPEAIPSTSPADPQGPHTSYRPVDLPDLGARCRPGSRRSRPRPRARLPGRRARKGDSLWRLRSRTQYGWVSVGIDHDTPAFAVESIARWWHRLFCHITENWRGRPLVDHETVVQLIGSVRTTTGLTVKAIAAEMLLDPLVAVETELHRIREIRADLEEYSRMDRATGAPRSGPNRKIHGRWRLPTRSRAQLHGAGAAAAGSTRLLGVATRLRRVGATGSRIGR
jgi:hypothetical protein